MEFIDWTLVKQRFSKQIDLTDADFNAFMNFFDYRIYKKKQCPVVQGDKCLYEYYVIQGCLRAFETDIYGNEHTIFFAIEDYWIGDLYAFLTESSSRYTVECLEDSQVLLINKSNVESLYDKIPKFERLMRLKITNAFIHLQKRYLNRLNKSAEERYLEFLEQYPQFANRIPNKHIASYLGIKEESLSRIRRHITQKSKR